MYHTLREREDVGITIPIDIFDQVNTTIVSTVDLPDYFIDVTQHVVCCYNYPDSNEMSDFDPYGSMLDPSLTQITEGEITLTDPD